ncbi:glucose-1-phosphate cytidylyltransferase [Azospirillum cavernae]|uniref:Glucose-1-phosphate cytidylyltransferase n=1 Tax=Azospirillum cavernae TaxID=2320860 RepID=A0A418VL24_9PROT|nr:glucose-1-phosphate cytidylyltransferase [Azospirillum cavernae]RJF76749.1 glucose-1-phosphate cytidylyltransferase [Azospirillum cavernae]
MKVVIFAGGRGTRLAEETQIRPKPMVQIGGFPIIWHIMKIYSHYGFNDFVICLGYLGNSIKEYFINYRMHCSDITIDLSRNEVQYQSDRSEPWRITLVDTGIDSSTAERLHRVRAHIGTETFLLTYGDGVGDVDVHQLVAAHRAGGRQATMTIVRPPARFGSTIVEEDRVVSFLEKPQAHEGLINGGFFVLEPSVIDFIDPDATGWEYQPLQRIVEAGQLTAYIHTGFWHAMDTVRDKIHLEQLWHTGTAPWKVWEG